MKELKHSADAALYREGIGALRSYLKFLCPSYTEIEIQQNMSEDHSLNDHDIGGIPTCTSIDLELTCQTMENVLEELVHLLNNESILPTQFTDPKKLCCFFAGLYPYQGLDAVMAGWFTGHALHLKVPYPEGNLLNKMIDILWDYTPQNPKPILHEYALPKGDGYFSEVIAEKEQYYAEYIHAPYLNQRPQYSSLLLMDEASDDQLRQIFNRILAFGGRSPDNVHLILTDNLNRIEALVTYFKAHLPLSLSSYWMNNYEYWKSGFLLNKTQYWDAECCLFVRDDNAFSKPGVVHVRLIDEATNELHSLFSNSHEVVDMRPLSSKHKPVPIKGHAWVKRILHAIEFLRQI